MLLMTGLDGKKHPTETQLAAVPKVKRIRLNGEFHADLDWWKRIAHQHCFAGVFVIFSGFDDVR